MAERIVAADHLDRFYTAEDGAALNALLLAPIKAGRDVELSFKGVDSVPTSFVNTAFVQLLDHVSFDTVRARLKIVDSNRHINEMIKRRLSFAAQERASAAE